MIDTALPRHPNRWAGAAVAVTVFWWGLLGLSNPYDDLGEALLTAGACAIAVAGGVAVIMVARLVLFFFVRRRRALASR